MIFLLDFRAFGEAHVRISPLNGGLSLNSLTVRLNLQSLHVSLFGIFKISFFYLKFSQTNIQGILGGGELSNVINAMVMDLVPGFFRTFEDQISVTLSNFLLPRINPLLSGLTLDDIRNLLP